MERSLFIAKTKNMQYFTSSLERLYFGTEFCERLVPTAHDIRQVLDFVREKRNRLFPGHTVCDRCRPQELAEDH